MKVARIILKAIGWIIAAPVRAACLAILLLYLLVCLIADWCKANL